MTCSTDLKKTIRFTLLFTIWWVCTNMPAPAATEKPLTPAELHLRIAQAVGKLPRENGYSLDGRFTLSVTGSNIQYQARILQLDGRRVVDFVQENPTRNMRYFLSGEYAWIATPEITADIRAEHIPYLARFDFHTIYAALLDTLAKASHTPDFRIERADADHEIFIHGRLPNGWKAVFTFNTMEYYPRKVVVTTDGPTDSAWLVPQVRPDKMWRAQHIPAPAKKFEIWLSDPVENSGYRFAQRLDFVENDVVMGSFFLNENPTVTANDPLFERPPDFPWEKSLQFTPDGKTAVSLFTSAAERSTLRTLLDQEPWAEWNRQNELLGYGAVILPRMAQLFPYPISPYTLLWVEIIGYLLFVFVIMKLHRWLGRSGRGRIHWKSMVAGFIVGCIVFISGCAAWMLHKPVERSRMALHAALRFALTEQPMFARATAFLMDDFTGQALAETMADIGKSSRNYALACDLVRTALSHAERTEIERELFFYARPLLGASSGWTANTVEAADIASGLGYAGLVLGNDSFVSTAEQVIQRMLAEQLSSGLYLEGPGPGARAMNAVADFSYAMAHTGHNSYYQNPHFQEYVATTLQMISPDGTLPLFGDTSLDDSADSSFFFMKVADKLPEAMARACVAAYNRYQQYGRFSASGNWRRLKTLTQALLEYYENPSVLLQYRRLITPANMPGKSFVSGNGQFAALRANDSPESLYLALDMLHTQNINYAGDALSFDLFGYGSPMLHGSGFPLRTSDGNRTKAANTLTFNNDRQTLNRSAGITAALINQPLFDMVRAQADNAYDYGQVTRDIVMVRPETHLPAYFVMLDDVFNFSPVTTVQWRLHGRGESASGIDGRVRWISTPFGPPGTFKGRRVLEFAHPVGIQGTQSSSTGMLRSRFPFLEQTTHVVQIEWTGSGRMISVLLPRLEQDSPPSIEAQGQYICRIGRSDWLSFGDLDRRIKAKNFTHISSYTLLRDRKEKFPALLMAFGIECRFGKHSILSDKPVTVSLDGLRGGISNDEPETRVEINSPEIRDGASFRIDGQTITASAPGILRFTLSEAGEHVLQ